ncbi:hypothetical protein P167DRAFT_604683 [Morchella conica CCBAS932]|uniref:Uncharacterized protein n=1 Tax=Morchella conica CCBAS932 TaxID=1392247 RepID=A0A3N4KT03_9PEZI|nr:hypothetical protein P167DRAFT_604683 [Morchella conica CCBAS932]
MAIPYTRRTPSLPSTESTLAPSQVQHQPSSSTLANSHTSPLRASPGSSSRSRTISSAFSLGRKPTKSRKAGGFLLDTATVNDGGERETHKDAREFQGGYGHRGLGTGISSLEPSMRGYRGPMAQANEELVTEDSDTARIVSLALANGATRKVETSRVAAQHRNTSNNMWAPEIGNGVGDGRDRWLSASSTMFGQPISQGNIHGKDRAVSPNRGFLMTSSIDTRRSVSIGGHSSGNGSRRLSPLNPSSSPPPAPGPVNPRQSYPSPISPLPSGFPYQQLQKQRGLQEQQELRELQRQYKFTEATIQRTLKAKRQLELSDLYKRLLEIYPSSDSPLTGSARHGSVGLSTGRVYNPLMSIRNKRIRNRERIQLDLSSWEDPGAVGQWVEDVAVAVHDSMEAGHVRPPRLPPPPQPSMSVTKTKRSRLDWVITPQELLAEFYWIEEADRLRREEIQRSDERADKIRKEQVKGSGSHTSLKSLLEKEHKKHRGSFELTLKKRSLRNLEDEGVDGPTKKDSKRKPKQSGEFHHSLLQLGSHRDGSEDLAYSNPPSSSDESGHSSESEVDYTSEYSDLEVDISGPEIDAKAKRKHHRRRRKLGDIITGGKHSKKKAKKKRGDTYILDADERRRRQEQEELEWMAEMGGRMQGPIARTYSADEEYDSTGRNGDPRKQDHSRMATAMTGMSLPTALGGSKSSLERYGNITALSVAGRKSVDFAEVVVPSIAISLSPPRIKVRDEGYDTDGRGRAKKKEDEGGKEEKRKTSPAKKLLERGQEALVKAREGSLDRRRESLDIDGPVHKGALKDKEKESRKNRLKGRVEKIRNEVGTKVDHFIFKRDPGGSAQPSPTGSIFAESVGSRSDDDRFRLSRENTISASEPEDEGRRSGRPWGRSSLEVPDTRKPTRTTTKYKSSFSLSAMPSIASPGVPSSPILAKWASKSRLMQDDFATSDVDTDDDQTSRPSRLSPPAQELSRDASPVGSVIFQASDRRRMPPIDRFRSIALEAIKTLPKQPVLAAEDIPGRKDTPESVEEPVFATRKELMMAKAHLTRSGIFARGITTKRARDVGTATIVATAKEHMLSSVAVSRDISAAEQVFVCKARSFADSTVSDLRKLIDRIRDDIETELVPSLTNVAESADELNEEMTTTCTLAVKGINDQVAAIARRKRRQLRWIRRGGYVLLEWVVLGVMWWVWLVVVVLNIFRGVFRGTIGAIRWILWI